MSFSGNMRPVSTSRELLPYSKSIMFFPISPKPPRGRMRSLFAIVKITFLLWSPDCFAADVADDEIYLLHPFHPLTLIHKSPASAISGRGQRDLTVERDERGESVQACDLDGLRAMERVFEGEFDLVAFEQILDPVARDGGVVDENFLPLRPDVAVPL